MKGEGLYVNSLVSLMKKFRYIKEPIPRNVYFGKEVGICNICHEKKAGMDAGVFSIRGNLGFVCTDCLSGGRLQKKTEKDQEPMFQDRFEALVNEANPYQLAVQLKKQNPNLSDKEAKRIADERTEEVMYRTPSFSSWQEHSWPNHCGDYCELQGEVGQEELNHLTPDSQGRKLLANMLFWEGDYPRDLESDFGGMTTDDFWKYLPDHAPRNNTDPTSYLILFKCLECAKLMGVIDFD